MCGLAGVWSRGGDTDGEAAVTAMAGALRHRGPDDDGTFADHEAGIALGHRRLSIVDLSASGAQPMTSPSGRYVLAFNGEIYNFRELRAELAGAGAAFRGHGDTEVMLAAFERWGVAGGVRRFCGMFAFAVWDRVERALHLGRDRLGEKPLYYGWFDGTLLFGSELKALRAHRRFADEVDRGALALYLRFGYVPAPYSIYRRVRKLEPGMLLTLRDGRQTLQRYWSAADAARAGADAPLAGDEDELVDQLDALLRAVVRQEMVADVPVGAFLSGGVDSSTLVALMQAEGNRPVRTFTIGFHAAAFDEAPWARAVAGWLGSAHTEQYVDAADALAVIPTLPTIWDEPFADASQIPTLLVARLARSAVTVSLSGDGADELFAGYDRYRRMRALFGLLRLVPDPLRAPLGAVLARLPLSRGRAQLLGRLVGERHGAAMYRTFVSNVCDPARLLRDTAEPPLPPDGAPDGLPLVERLMLIDQTGYLPDDILVKVDRAAMGVSLESRAPFLDHRLVEFAWRVPTRLKLSRRTGKHLLRRLLHRYVPRHLVERPKTGFAVPLSAWLAGPLRDWTAALLDERRLRQDGFFDAREIAARLDQHRRGHANWERLIWSLVMFQAWLDSARAVPS
jgi:asparagine synthase (glutamine-hydrolysing)